jgi:hypothetical protein
MKKIIFHRKMTAHAGLSGAAFDDLKAKLWEFMKEEIYPNENAFREQNHNIGHASREWTHRTFFFVRHTSWR